MEVLALVLLALSSIHDGSDAFSIQPKTASLFPSRSTNDISRVVAKKNIILHASSSSSKHQHDKNFSNNEGESKRWKSLVRTVRERSDTLRSAGFYDNQNQGDFVEPMTAGAKTNITLFLLALGYKWYRSIFINKVRHINFHLEVLVFLLHVSV